ncbi:MAG: hypothetical protein PHY93_00900 [Bacteriovorax sp.]|nr:hypothetical protein [Bacteriovorax sp.]
MKTLFTTILLFSISILAHAGESFVPLQKGVRMASDDLLYGDNVLSSREAQDLSNFKNIDLSLLQPKSNEIWSPEKSVLNDQEAIAVQDGEVLTFEGSLTSNTGLYRFNAIPENSSNIYTIHLDKTLHTLLLRKNLLRKLGYKIPAIKYLKKVFIQFNSVEEREQFLKKDVPENTLGAADRWVKNVNELTLELQDVAVTEPSETDFYNVAMGVPTQTINSRTLRSLLLPYSLLDLFESVNKYNWIDGKVDNRSVVLPHFTGNDFATTLEDAQWMIRRINKLSRIEIKEVVDQAFFPSEISSVLVEKIISRRNSVSRLFSEKVKEMDFNQKISIGESLKEGKVLQKDFPGYASRFAYGDAESPFSQLQYYLFSKIQGNILDDLMAKANSYIQAFDINKVRSTFFQKQFQDGLNNFLQTGVIKPIGISTWSTPLVNGHLIFSRDIVLGNYLGTDNLVQLADTIGASVNLGYYLGVEGLGNNIAGSAKADLALVRTYAHVKPVKSLKQSLKEPYKNMFIPLLKHSLKEEYLSLSELKNSTMANDEKAKKIQGILKEIDQNLDTGESLIITDRLMPSAEVKINFSNGIVGAGVGVGGSIAIIKRVHFYKKSPKVLQIYDDNGFVEDVNLSFQVNAYIPVLKISGKFDSGKYKIKSYMVNISGDLDENPNLYANALGVYNVLKNRDFEILSSTVTPVKMDAQFKDRSLGFSLLLWKMRAIKGKTYYDIEAKDGVNGTYFSLNKDFSNGFNAETFSKQMANYYLSKQLDGDITLTVDSDNLNPGDSFFGRSHTQKIRFEASVNADKKFERKFISVSDTKQGWSVSSKHLKKMMEKINNKFQSTLFDVNQIDFGKFRLFRVGYHVNLYDRGIERLNSIKIEELNAIEARYKKERGCDSQNEAYYTPICGDLRIIKGGIKKCLKNKGEEDRAACNLELIDEMLYSLEFNDFKQIIGENNLYVYGTMDGFRQHSEILNDTIFSNTVGKIGSKEWNGPLDIVRELLGLSGGEFSGSWLRESI